MSHFDLTRMGGARPGRALLRIRNHAAGRRDLRLTRREGGYVTLIAAEPGDTFVEVEDFGTYELSDPADLRGMACPGASLTGVIAGTPIRTQRGDVAVDAIVHGDRVLTNDGTLHAVLDVRAARGSGLGRCASVAIPAGALGNARPVQCGPEQRIRISDWRAELMHDSGQIMVAARDLVALSGIKRRRALSVCYFRVILDQPALILSGGLWIETGQTLWTGGSDAAPGSTVEAPADLPHPRRADAS